EAVSTTAKQAVFAKSSCGNPEKLRVDFPTCATSASAAPEHGFYRNNGEKIAEAFRNSSPRVPCRSRSSSRRSKLMSELAAYFWRTFGVLSAYQRDRLNRYFPAPVRSPSG